jgi:archaellum component FlaF (FlaF/FlaG flagellin family)
MRFRRSAVKFFLSVFVFTGYLYAASDLINVDVTSDGANLYRVGKLAHIQTESCSHISHNEHAIQRGTTLVFPNGDTCHVIGILCSLDNVRSIGKDLYKSGIALIETKDCDYTTQGEDATVTLTYTDSRGHDNITFSNHKVCETLTIRTMQ